MLRGGAVLAAALAFTAVPSSAQQVRGGTTVARSQCEGCDSTASLVARRRQIDAEIANLTVELARNRMLYLNLRSRLAPDSPEPPRNERERAELQARLAAQSSLMEQLTRQLSVLCVQQEPVRGYLGVDVASPLTTDLGPGGRSSTHVSYPVVQRVEPGSPAERAGIVVFDTIIAINRMDTRGNSLDAFVREPGEKITLTLARDGARRTVNVTVGVRPATFAGSCMQYRELHITNASGANVSALRAPGSARGATQVAGTIGATGTGGGRPGRATVRTRVGPVASGQQPVTIAMRDSSAGTAFIVLTTGPLFLNRGGSSALVAGAEVSLVLGALKAMFAVEHGALVLNVAPRTPAQNSGLAEGDVIVSANGEAVTSIAVLQRAIHAAHEKRNLPLQIIREKQPKSILLHW